MYVTNRVDNTLRHFTNTWGTAPAPTGITVPSAIWGTSASALQVSAIFGIECPTGRTDAETLQFDRFAFEHQLGSHSWDPLGGVAVSLIQDGWSLHANATYLHTTDSREGTDLGDVVNYNLAAVYRIAHDDYFSQPCPHCQAAGLSRPLHGCCGHWGRALDLVVELNGGVG